MLHTKFYENRPADSGEEDFLKGFYHIWAWRPSWSCDPDHVNNFFHFLVPESFHTKFSSEWPSTF